MAVSIDKLLSNLNNFADLGRQKAFELGNPFYYQEKGDEKYWRKELPNGEVYLVIFEVEYDEENRPVRIVDIFEKLID